MGCEFNSGIVDKNNGLTTRTVLKDYLNRVIRNAKEDYGHQGYTGSFAEATGIEFRNKKFKTVDGAEDWLMDMDNVPKFGPIVVVSTETKWVYGANCSS